MNEEYYKEKKAHYEECLYQALLAFIAEPYHTTRVRVDSVMQARISLETDYKLWETENQKR